MNWLENLARMLVAATEPGGWAEYAHLIKAAADHAKDHQPIGGASERAKEIGRRIYARCVDVATGKEPMNLRVIATMAGCSEDRIRPRGE
jgi:hypothetical protein